MGANTKDEQLRVKTLLSDTVTLLCKNGLAFKKNLKVQGLLGITVDDDEVFIVHLNETLGDLVSASDENQTGDCQTPSKSSESGRRSPNRRKRRRSRDTVRSPTPQESQDSIIDLDPDIEIKADPDAILVDEVKFEGSPSKQSCRLADEGLNLAINSISSLDQSFPGGNASLSTTPNRPGFRSFDTSMSGNSTTTSAASPYITAMVPNVADPSQSPGSSSFQWDSSSAQGLPGMSSWASQASAQVAQQTMSQPGTSQGSPGGYNPEQRTGTSSTLWSAEEGRTDLIGTQSIPVVKEEMSMESEHGLKPVYIVPNASSSTSSPCKNLAEVGHLGQETPSGSGKKKDLKCATCGLELSNLSNLRQHIKKHESPQHKCDECPSAFFASYKLRSHVEIVHRGVRHQCPKAGCSSSFVNKYALKQHIAGHEGKYRLVCQLCGKGFTDSTGYNGHMDSHLGRKPYKCGKCNKRFVMNSGRKRHQKTCGLSLGFGSVPK